MWHRYFSVWFLILICALGSAEEPATATVPVQPAPAETPARAAGALPKYPLTCDSFGAIEDSFDNISENMNTYKEEVELELGPMTDILEALQASPQEYLRKNIDYDATFSKMMNNPAKYRGHIVRLAGVLKRFSETRIGAVKIWKGQTANIQGQIISFRSLEPLPPKIEMGKPVELVGIFMQRFGYLDDQPGDRIRLTPLIYIRRLEHFVEEGEGSSPMDNFILSLSIIACLGFGGFFWYRVRLMNAKPTHFERKRSMRPVKAVITKKIANPVKKTEP